jgi:transposase
MSQFYAWLGKRKSSRIRLAVMDMWKPFRLATAAHAPQAAILFDKFHANDANGAPVFLRDLWPDDTEEIRRRQEER